MKNLSLIVGVLSTIILSIYCVDFHTEPILQKLNQKSTQTIKQQVYTEVITKPIVPKVIHKVKQLQVSIKEEKVETPNKVTVKKENELDVLTKKILEDMKKNKDNKWIQ